MNLREAIWDQNGRRRQYSPELPGACGEMLVLGRCLAAVPDSHYGPYLCGPVRQCYRRALESGLCWQHEHEDWHWGQKQAAAMACVKGGSNGQD